MNEACIFHPEHRAVEHCEVCQRPLCGLCLWYTEDGYRLCEEHAQERAAAGEPILPPQTYHEALHHQVVQPADQWPAGVYRGNNYDVGAVVAAVAAVTTIGSCMGGVYCLPFVIFLMGMAVYLKADEAVDRRRTRLFAGIGMGITGLLFVALLAFISFYIVMFVFLILASNP